ncbi:MAG: SH3 domain-containing protein [Anaerolineae bacterium]|nr:SH3 domain-containing protein [Anaerolineae bacterium]
MGLRLSHRWGSKSSAAFVISVIALISILGATTAWANEPDPAVAQQPTATPIQLQMPTATPTLGPPTETPTRTPTPAGLPQIEAITSPTNIRSTADITENNKVGEIHPGTKYDVIGQYFEWYYIAVPEIPSGRAWVHNSVVAVDGDPAAIPQFEQEGVPTVDADLLAVQQTALAISATPGAGATLTAQALLAPTGISTAAPGDEPTLAPGERLPTFTHPAASVTPIPFPRTNPPSETGGLAPIVPILALGALGLMGLLVSIMRRL